MATATVTTEYCNLSLQELRESLTNPRQRFSGKCGDRRNVHRFFRGTRRCQKRGTSRLSPGFSPQWLPSPQAVLTDFAPTTPEVRTLEQAV
jgi:hypothetical protein